MVNQWLMGNLLVFASNYRGRLCPLQFWAVFCAGFGCSNVVSVSKIVGEVGNIRIFVQNSRFFSTISMVKLENNGIGAESVDTNRIARLMSCL